MVAAAVMAAVVKHAKLPSTSKIPFFFPFFYCLPARPRGWTPFFFRKKFTSIEGKRGKKCHRNANG